VYNPVKFGLVFLGGFLQVL